MYLGEIRIVDLTRTPWDREKSDPEKGEYVFTGDKVYVDGAAYRTKANRPAWYFCWIRYDPRDGLKDVRDHQIKWKYSYVTKDDSYWPEGLPLDVNGHYAYGDVVLMKCPLIEELRKRELARQMSDGQAMSTFSKFEKLTEGTGSVLTAADEGYIDQLTKEYLGG
jgi:hypothetical protein